jgi:hypothetical protein
VTRWRRGGGFRATSVRTGRTDRPSRQGVIGIGFHHDGAPALGAWRVAGIHRMSFGWANRHRTTQTSPRELPRKLLPTRAKEAKGDDARSAKFTKCCLGLVGPGLDLKKAHNPLYWASNPSTRPRKIAVLRRPLGFQPNGRGRVIFGARANEGR